MPPRWGTSMVVVFGMMGIDEWLLGRDVGDACAVLLVYSDALYLLFEEIQKSLWRL
jgi:hypothetical protein